MQQQNVIDHLLTQIQSPYFIFSDKKPKTDKQPLFKVIVVLLGELVYQLIILNISYLFVFMF